VSPFGKFSPKKSIDFEGQPLDDSHEPLEAKYFDESN
jgi:hypothetical protein